MTQQENNLVFVYNEILKDNYNYDLDGNGGFINVTTQNNVHKFLHCPHLSYRELQALKTLLNSNNYLNSTYYLGSKNDNDYFFTNNSSGGRFSGNVLRVDKDFNIYQYNVAIGTFDNTHALYNQIQAFQKAVNTNNNITSSCIFNQNIYEELQFYPNDYLPSMLYIALPVLIFLITLKILRKGLFK